MLVALGQAFVSVLMTLSAENSFVGNARFEDVLPVGAVSRLGTTRFRVGAPVDLLAVSSDGRMVFCRNRRLALHVFDGSTGKAQRRRDGTEDNILTAMFADAGIGVWQVNDGMELRELNNNRCLYKLQGELEGFGLAALSPDKRLLAMTSESEDRLRLWDCQKSELGRVLGVPRGSAACFTPDGSKLFTADSDGFVCAWAPSTGKKLARWNAEDNCRINSLAFTPDGNTLVTATDKGRISLWDPSTGRLRARLLGHTDRINQVIFSPSGRRLASCSHDKTVRIWDPVTGGQLFQFEPEDATARCLAFLPNGATLLSGHESGVIHVWNLTNGIEAKEFAIPSTVKTLAFSADGKRLISGGADKQIHVWNIATAKNFSDLAGHRRSVQSVAMSRQNDMLASAGWEGSLRLWNVQSGKEICCLQDEPKPLGVVAFSPDGKKLASGGIDGFVYLWDVASRKERKKLVGHAGFILSIAFSQDGKMIASTGGVIVVLLGC